MVREQPNLFSEKNTHINSGGSCGVNHIILSSNHYDKTWKDFALIKSAD